MADRADSMDSVGRLVLGITRPLTRRAERRTRGEQFAAVGLARKQVFPLVAYPYRGDTEGPDWY